MKKFDNRHMSEDQILQAVDAAICEYMNMVVRLEAGTNMEAITKYSYWLFKYSGLARVEFGQVEDEND